MNDDMKELVRSAEEKGYELVKFEEYDKIVNNMINKQFSLIFEKKQNNGE